MKCSAVLIPKSVINTCMHPSPGSHILASISFVTLIASKMANSLLIQNPGTTKSCFLLPQHSILIRHENTSLPFSKPRQPFTRKQSKLVMRSVLGSLNPLSRFTTTSGDAVKVKATVTVKTILGGIFDNVGITRPLDDLTSLLSGTFLLELVSSELDPKTGSEKATIKAHAQKFSPRIDEIKYEAKFTVPAGFGEIGAILVENELHKEMYIDEIILEGLPNGPIKLACESFVHSSYDNSTKRVFFTNKSYLPLETPNGLKKLRKQELENLRGNGQGEREEADRIYDYDTYNDLGVPEKNDLARPVLGGSQHPYPRRCRTGRPPSKKDPSSESRSFKVYVPRDEAFSAVKYASFAAKGLDSVISTVLPFLEAMLVDKMQGFPNFPHIDSLYKQGIKLPKDFLGVLTSIPAAAIKTFRDGGDEFLLFHPSELIERDRHSWIRDEELSRQTLAGCNPMAIRLVTEWPLKSKLDPQIYGSPESLITSELIEKQIGEAMTVNEALEKKRLFMLDYHDLYLPSVNKVRELESNVFYGSRTLFFLTAEGVLTPVAIELTRPPAEGKPQWRQVFTASVDPTENWLWRLAKAHVCSHNSVHHQLVSHWLRTHCCVEPYIIAANRQLSAMHPIYRLLKPHLRYTMEINALARKSLISADGFIEQNFTPGKYSIELSSHAYDKLWRFDQEALPADLIARGMAVEDPTAKHGLRLTIEDYPYANDGLALWDGIKQWVSDCVNHYYPEASKVESDEELQAWWTEVRTQGHADKKDEPWWPVLKTQEDLIQVVTTIIWVAAGHHAAVNFGQYAYGGYFPNLPTIARTTMPSEDPLELEFKEFLKNPEATLLECFPSQIQALTVMLILDVLSTHSPDEEYIGDKLEPCWEDEPVIKAAFEKFNAKMKELEETIDAKNSDLNLKNRSGAGIIPYQLLKPSSPAGLTGKGVPNSISI